MSLSKYPAATFPVCLSKRAPMAHATRGPQMIFYCLTPSYYYGAAPGIQQSFAGDVLMV